MAKHTYLTMRAEQPLIVCLAPTGMVPTKKNTPHIPVSVSEIVTEVLTAAACGVTMVHIHARDSQEQPSHEKERYGRIIAGIRAECPDLVICVSCSGRIDAEFEKRADVLALSGPLKPDLASLTPASLNFADQASLNAPATIKALASRMAECDIRPEIEIFDLGMANYLRYLADRQVITPPYYVNVMLGNIASAQADLLEIATILRALPREAICTLGGLGQAQMPVAALAVAAADGLRIGLEDNLWMDAARRSLATNRMLVEKVTDMARSAGRPLMTPCELRRRLNLDIPVRVT